MIDRHVRGRFGAPICGLSAAGEINVPTPVMIRPELTGTAPLIKDLAAAPASAFPGWRRHKECGAGKRCREPWRSLARPRRNAAVPASRVEIAPPGRLAQGAAKQGRRKVSL